MKKIAYIILNYKTYKDTIRVAKEILAFGRENEVVIIVDNNSPNESSSELHHSFDDVPRVDVIDSPENGGYAKGNNYGLRYVKKFEPEFVCVINNDVHFTAETIDNLAAIYPKLPQVGVISPLQKLPGDKVANFPTLKLPDFEYDVRSYLLLCGNPNHKYERTSPEFDVQEVGVIPGAFLFTKYDLLERLEFFDEETFLFCEERFLGKKIQELGLKNYIVLNECYVHEHSKTISSEASIRRQMKMMLAGRLLFTKKYRTKPHIKCALLHFVYYYCVAWHTMRGVLMNH